MTDVEEQVLGGHQELVGEVEFERGSDRQVLSRCLKIGGHEGVVIKHIKPKPQEQVRPEGLGKLGLAWGPPDILALCPHSA